MLNIPVKVSSTIYKSNSTISYKVIPSKKTKPVYSGRLIIEGDNPSYLQIPTPRIAEGAYEVQVELLLYDTNRSAQQNPRTSFVLEITGLTKELADQAWKRKWLYAGARIGFSVHNYVLNTQADVKAKPNVSFEGALQADVQIFIFRDVFSLGVQTELIFCGDKVFVEASNGDVTTNASILQIPLLAKFTYRPRTFYIAGFIGPYIAVPLGQMKIAYNGADTSYKFSSTIGLTGGVEGGLKLGPGVLFLDLRYSGDFKFFRANDAAQFRRNMFSVSAGYSMGFFDK